MPVHLILYAVSGACLAYDGMNECTRHACCVHTVVVVISFWLIPTGRHGEINSAEQLG